DIPCRPTLACTISNKDYYIKFLVVDDCYENKYDSIFEHLFDTEDEEEMLGCMAGVDYDVICEWKDAYTVGDVI
ncbi:hypothetical protein, partial [Streptococcus pneumoniae]|uniref:hypothetical protein n=1 Tax=Streptococcus pneumoniae TaxID=1313 RepID=UPI0018B0C96C